jgi:hypothetical protein
MIMFGPRPAFPVPVGLAAQYADSGSSGFSLSGTVLVIVLLGGGVLLFRRFLLPTVRSTLGIAKGVLASRAGRILGVVGVVVLGILLLGGL